REHEQEPEDAASLAAGNEALESLDEGELGEARPPRKERERAREEPDGSHRRAEADAAIPREQRRHDQRERQRDGVPHRLACPRFERARVAAAEAQRESAVGRVAEPEEERRERERHRRQLREEE